MPWFKVDDKFHSHPKVMELSPAAVGLWALAGSWCADYLTDGAIRKGQIRRLGGTEAEAQELVDAGLWIPTDDGWQFRDWTEYQPTREAVEAERNSAKERMRRAREQRQSSKDVRANTTRSSANPVPVPVTSKEVNSSEPPKPRKKPSTALPDDWAPTEKHAAKAAELSLNLQTEAEKFRTFHQSKDNRYADWGKAFHTWLTRAAEYQQRPAPQSAADRVMQRAQERHERLATYQPTSWDQVFNTKQIGEGT